MSGSTGLATRAASDKLRIACRTEEVWSLVTSPAPALATEIVGLGGVWRSNPSLSALVGIR